MSIARFLPLVIIFVFCSFSSIAKRDTYSPIEYPIEVFRWLNEQKQWTDTTTIELNTKNYVGNARWLYVQVNNLNHVSSMLYRLKADTAKDWSNWQVAQPDFSQFPKDKAYGGLNGGFSTTEFVTPITGLKANTSYQLQFKYQHIPGSDTSGYRIIDLALWLDNNKLSDNQIANGRMEITGVNWQGPFANDIKRKAKAQQGEKLWHGEAGEKLIDANGQAMLASCSDCHAKSGWDLKYFNYSDKSIIARSSFHGLSHEEGAMIAQYIRDLSFTRSEKGRPWQPPFQPGPEADDDAFEWAAGQGLENVLDDDLQMLPDLFGSPNPSEQDIRKTINQFAGNTNIRTQRIAVQFPDWNAWLPKVHPKDLVTQGLLSEVDYQRVEQAYLNTRQKVDSPEKVVTLNAQKAGAIYAHNGLFAAMAELSIMLHNVLQGKDLPSPRSPEWADNNPEYQPERETMKRSLSPWLSVKMFEIIHEFDLHALPDYGHIEDAEEETFQWPTREWVVFQNAAHIISETRWASYFSVTDVTPAQQTRGIYLSSIWYQLQLTLTPGHRKGGVVNANDFAYNLHHVHKLGERTGFYEPTRFLQNYLKTAEQRNNGMTPAQSHRGPIRGWNMRELSPRHLWGSTLGSSATFDALGPVLKTRIQNVFFDEVADKLLSFKETDWLRTAVDQKGRTDFELEYRDTVPERGRSNCLFHHRRATGGCSDENDAVEIDTIYTLLHLLKEDQQIDASVFNKLRAWADARWDHKDWPIYSPAVIQRGELNEK